MKINNLSLALTLALVLGSSALTVNAADPTAADTTRLATTASATTNTAPATTTTVAATNNITNTTIVPTVTAKLAPGVYTDTIAHWAKIPIQNMSNAGFISGYGDGTFRPDNLISREQIAAMYAKILKAQLSEKDLKKLTDKADSIKYTDVASTRWSSEAIDLVSASGVMDDNKSDKFNPTDTLSKEDFAITAAKLGDILNIKNKNPNGTVEFKDSNEISDKAKAAITTLGQEGFIGYGNYVSFRPTAQITRGETAAILYRMVTGANLKSAKVETATTKTSTVATITKTAAISGKTATTSTATKATTAATTATTATKTTTTVVKTTVAKTGAVKPLTETQRTALEDCVFTELNKQYKTPEAFQNYGVMYWRDNLLHVALKNDADIPTTKANLAATGTSTVQNHVVVEPSQYSQTEYDTIDSNFRRYYESHEKTGSILATFPDVANDQLYAVVTTATADTQQNVKKVFGDKVKMYIKH